MEPSERFALSMNDILLLVSELRETALEIHCNIEVFFGTETDWQKVNNRIAGFEDRFNALEAALGELVPDPEWHVEKDLSMMMTELRSIGEVFGKMRQDVLRALQESPYRVM